MRASLLGSIFWLAVASAGSWVSAVLAQAQVDVGVEARFDPGTQLEAGVTTVLEVTLSNSGVDAAPEPRVSMSFALVGNAGVLSLLLLPETAPCSFSPFLADGLPGQPATKGVVLRTAPLAPGATVQCSLGLATVEGAAGTVPLRIYALGGFFGVVDADMSSNELAVPIRLGAAPPALPVPIRVPSGDVWALVALGILALLAGRNGLMGRARDKGDGGN